MLYRGEQAWFQDPLFLESGRKRLLVLLFLYEVGTAAPGRAGSRADIEARLPPCLLYTSPSPRDRQKSRMPSSA